ncbi:MAG TPA: signal peptidase II, partial [Fimbriimonadaceae bacterium]|nr:signal peptidase II [Fimbriimonadaceae bacterium]
MSGRWIFLTVALSAIAADQAVKAWVRAALVERESIGSPWPGVFEITLTYNDRIAFVMLRGAGVLLAPIALAIVLVAAIDSFRHSHLCRAIHFAMWVLSGG